MENNKSKLGPKKSSLTSVMQNVRDVASNIELNEAEWSLCRSVTVFVVGLALTLQLKAVIHDVIT